MSLCCAIVPHYAPVRNRKLVADVDKIFSLQFRKGVQIVHMQNIDVFLRRTITTLLWLAGVLVFFRCLLTPLLPFLLALGLSALAEPTVTKLRRRLRVRRSFAAVAVTTLVLVVFGGGIALLVLRLVVELRDWSASLPEAVARFPAVWNGFLDRLELWYGNSPVFIRSALDLLAEQLEQEAPSLAGSVGEWLMGEVSGILAAAPKAGLFLMTTVLAVYFTSVSYPAILAFLKRQLPLPWQSRCREAARCFRSTMLKWLRAEVLLLLVTFGILLMGFTWIGIDFALLAAAFTALVDALPVLGTGTVLLPWAAGCFLLGDTQQGLSILALYGAAFLAHTLLEPRLLAGQAGLPPITALLAMYVGFHFMGVGGMVLLPIVLLLAKQLQDAGVIHIWR